MSDASQFGEYNKWTGRKDTALRRTKLDCGCPNLGAVFFHLWCDRLACEQHANDPHDCGEYAGVKSGTEEVSDPGAAETPTWTMNPGVDIPRANVCRNCGSLLALDVPLCPPCEGLPPCNATRWAAIWGATAMCLLPVGHDGREHQSVEGWTWRDRVYQVEALRPFLTQALDREAAALATRVRRIAEEVVAREIVDQPEPDAHPVDASSDTAPDAPRKSKLSELAAALRARARRGGPR